MSLNSHKVSNKFAGFCVLLPLKNMSFLRQISEYLYLRKPDPNQQRTQWVKYMHGINRLSILLFLVALIILAIKLMVKK
jgi:hypothetical protein